MAVKLFDYKSFVDDRGTFLNIPLNYPAVGFEGKRTYICSNFQKNTVRGFHYHAKEQKVYICLKGAIKFVLVKGAKSGGDINSTSFKPVITRPEIYTLSANTSKALYVPEDYANAWQTLTDDAILIGVSSATLEESINDDIRFDPIIVEHLFEVKWR